MKTTQLITMTAIFLAGLNASYAQTANITKKAAPAANETIDLSKVDQKKLMELIKKNPDVLKEDAGGNFVGNGGDAVVKDGKVTLRDFLKENAIEQVDSSRKFAESVPEFKELVIELMKAHPMFGLAVWNQIAENEVWTTQAELPLLPETATALVGDKAEIQVAIRQGNRIIISLPAFEQVDKASILLHEAMHGLIDEKGAWLHENVRAVVRAVKDMRGQMTYTKIRQLLIKSKATNFSDETAHDKPETIENLKMMLLEKGSKTQRCALYRSFYQINSDEWILPHSMSFIASISKGSMMLDQWSDYASCDEKNVVSFYRNKYPQLDYLYKNLNYVRQIGLDICSVRYVEARDRQEYSQIIASGVESLQQFAQMKSEILQQGESKNRLERAIAKTFIYYIHHYALRQNSFEEGVAEAQANLSNRDANCRWR